MPNLGDQNFEIARRAMKSSIASASGASARDSGRRIFLGGKVVCSATYHT